MMLLLDLDDTLIDGERAFRSWLDAWLTRFPESDRPDMAAFLTGESVRGWYPREAFAVFAERFPGAPAPDEVHADYLAEAPTHIRFVDGAREALARARDLGWRLGVVTNGPAGLQGAKVARLGLADLVDAVVISGEVGVAKPDPAIFALAASQLGVPAAPGWMIGDNPLADIGGAHASGLRSVWLRLGRTWAPGDGKVDLEADSLTEAVGLVLQAREGASG